MTVSDQEERTKAIEAFKEGKKDVLVATDVASKGLDFPAIQHVVNYDMPEEIENYGKRTCVWPGLLDVNSLCRLQFFLTRLRLVLMRLSCFSPQNWKNWTIWQNWYCHHLYQQRLW